MCHSSRIFNWLFEGMRRKYEWISLRKYTLFFACFSSSLSSCYFYILFLLSLFSFPMIIYSLLSSCSLSSHKDTVFLLESFFKYKDEVTILEILNNNYLRTNIALFQFILFFSSNVLFNIELRRSSRMSLVDWQHFDSFIVEDENCYQ